MYDSSTCAYDAPSSILDYNGNTQTKVVGSNTTTYAWDFENRLSSVTLPGSGGTVSFKYDPFGRRIYKSSSSGTSIHAYDGDNLIEETNAAGTAVARYSQGLNIDEPLAMLCSSTTSYYQADGLDSVSSLSNAAGALAQTYTFNSFGNQTASSGSLTNTFRYAGREFDTETGAVCTRTEGLACDPDKQRTAVHSLGCDGEWAHHGLWVPYSLRRCENRPRRTRISDASDSREQGGGGYGTRTGVRTRQEAKSAHNALIDRKLVSDGRRWLLSPKKEVSGTFKYGTSWTESFKYDPFGRRIYKSS